MRTIHIYCDGGFGNRFNGLISGLLLAKAADLEPIVVWPRNNWCGAGFFDLFENDYTVIERELLTYVPEKDKFHFYMILDHLDMGVAFKSPLQTSTLDEAVAYIMESDKDVYYHTPLIPVFLEGKSIHNQVRDLRFHQKILERVEEFVNEQKSTDFFGVQIRKTDFGNNGADDNNLFDLISSCPQKRFFVCSDDKDVEQRFGKLPNVLIHKKRAHVEKLVEGGWNTATRDHSGRVYACNVNRNADSVEDAVVDLLILSRSQIVGTSNSTFLNTALLLKQVYEGGKQV
jgi:hypothetical protein